MFSQQSGHIKKLQEENQSLLKKHCKTLESNLALQKVMQWTLNRSSFLKDQVREQWKKPLDTHASSEADIDPHAISHSSPTFHEEIDKVYPPLLLVDIPTENPVQENIMRNEKIPSPNALQLRKNVLPINHLQSLLNQTQRHFYVTQTANSLTWRNRFTQSENSNTSDVQWSKTGGMLHKLIFKNTPGYLLSIQGQIIWRQLLRWFCFWNFRFCHGGFHQVPQEQNTIFHSFTTLWFTA